MKNYHPVLSAGLLLSLLLLLPTTSFAHDGDLRVNDASYGARGRFCDATYAIEQSCRGRSSCVVRASNSLCGDPIPNVLKTLQINYGCGQGERRSQRVREGDRVRIECPDRGYDRDWDRGRNRLTIQQVDYGIRPRYCDATRAVAAQCNGQRACKVEIGNHLCGDPRPNRLKLARIRYSCGGWAETIQVDEGNAAFLSCDRRGGRQEVYKDDDYRERKYDPDYDREERDWRHK